MRLIDADVFDAIINDDGTIDEYATETARNAMLIMPTVDAVPVIRCKDCVHKSEYGYCTLYLNFHHLTEDMGYCSDAERKEECGQRSAD